MLWHWSIDVRKFRTENPKSYLIWRRSRKLIQHAVNFLSKNKWVTSGRIYVSKQEDTGIIRHSPVLIASAFRKTIPRYEYVSLSFVLSEVIPQEVSVIDQEKERRRSFSKYLLIGKY